MRARSCARRGRSHDEDGHGRALESALRVNETGERFSQPRLYNREGQRSPWLPGRVFSGFQASPRQGRIQAPSGAPTRRPSTKIRRGSPSSSSSSPSFNPSGTRDQTQAGTRMNHVAKAGRGLRGGNERKREDRRRERHRERIERVEETDRDKGDRERARAREREKMRFRLAITWASRDKERPSKNPGPPCGKTWADPGRTSAPHRPPLPRTRAASSRGQRTRKSESERPSSFRT